MPTTDREREKPISCVRDPYNWDSSPPPPSPPSYPIIVLRPEDFLQAGSVHIKQVLSCLLFYLPCFEETTPATKLPPVSTTPAATFAPVSRTLAKLVDKFAGGVIDTDGKFAAGVIDTGGNYATVVVDTGGNFATGVIDTSGALWLANISANFPKNSKRT